jgi:hypothetical protein
VLSIAAQAETAALGLPILYRRLQYRASIGARASCEVALLMRNACGRRSQTRGKADLMRRRFRFDAIFKSIGSSDCTGVDIGYQGWRKNFHQGDR